MAEEFGLVGHCDLCGAPSDARVQECNWLSCTFAHCEAGLYHQDCLEKFLKSNKLEKSRKTGFKCPRGCGKGTNFPSPCPGRIDKSHPVHPRNEDAKKKRQAAVIVQEPVKPGKQIQSATKPKAKEEKAIEVSKKEACVAIKANGSIPASKLEKPAAVAVAAQQAKKSDVIDREKLMELKAQVRREIGLGPASTVASRGQDGLKASSSSKSGYEYGMGVGVSNSGASSGASGSNGAGSSAWCKSSASLSFSSSSPSLSSVPEPPSAPSITTLAQLPKLQQFFQAASNKKSVQAKSAAAAAGSGLQPLSRASSLATPAPPPAPQPVAAAATAWPALPSSQPSTSAPSTPAAQQPQPTPLKTSDPLMTLLSSSKSPLLASTPGEAPGSSSSRSAVGSSSTSSGGGSSSSVGLTVSSSGSSSSGSGSTSSKATVGDRPSGIPSSSSAAFVSTASSSTSSAPHNPHVAGSAASSGSCELPGSAGSAWVSATVTATMAGVPKSGFSQLSRAASGVGLARGISSDHVQEEASTGPLSSSTSATARGHSRSNSHGGGGGGAEPQGTSISLVDASSVAGGKGGKGSADADHAGLAVTAASTPGGLSSSSKGGASLHRHAAGKSGAESTSAGHAKDGHSLFSVVPEEAASGSDRNASGTSSSAGALMGTLIGPKAAQASSSSPAANSPSATTVLPAPKLASPSAEVGQRGRASASPPPSSAASTPEALEDMFIHCLVDRKVRHLISQLQRLGVPSWLGGAAIQRFGSNLIRAIGWILEADILNPEEMLARNAGLPGSEDVDIDAELQLLAELQGSLGLSLTTLQQCVVDCRGDVVDATAAAAREHSAAAARRSNCGISSDDKVVSLPGPSSGLLFGGGAKAGLSLGSFASGSSSASGSGFRSGLGSGAVGSGMGVLPAFDRNSSLLGGSGSKSARAVAPGSDRDQLHLSNNASQLLNGGARTGGGGPFGHGSPFSLSPKTDNRRMFSTLGSSQDDSSVLGDAAGSGGGFNGFATSAAMASFGGWLNDGSGAGKTLVPEFNLGKESLGGYRTSQSFYGAVGLTKNAVGASAALQFGAPGLRSMAQREEVFSGNAGSGAIGMGFEAGGAKGGDCLALRDNLRSGVSELGEESMGGGAYERLLRELGPPGFGKVASTADSGSGIMLSHGQQWRSPASLDSSSPFGPPSFGGAAISEVGSSGNGENNKNSRLLGRGYPNGSCGLLNGNHSHPLGKFVDSGYGTSSSGEGSADVSDSHDVVKDSQRNGAGARLDSDFAFSVSLRNDSGVSLAGQLTANEATRNVNKATSKQWL